MPTPIRPIPEAVTQWTSRMRWLRWIDAIGAWAVLWGGLLWLLGTAPAKYASVLALGVLGIGLALPVVRIHWRPISGWVGLAMSRDLQPGDRAWYVRSDRVDLVLVTARHGLRVAIARPDLADDESLDVRRTRVLLLPAAGA